MILFKKSFWTIVLSVILTFVIECLFAVLFLIIWASIYYTTEYEPLNTGTPVLLAKVFLILVPFVYNVKKIVAAYKAKDFVTVVGFLGITIVYSVLITLPSGGGR